MCRGRVDDHGAAPSSALRWLGGRGHALAAALVYLVIAVWADSQQPFAGEAAAAEATDVLSPEQRAMLSTLEQEKNTYPPITTHCILRWRPAN